MYKNLKVCHKKSQYPLNIEIIDTSIGQYKLTEKRIIVRGVVIKNHKILLVYPKKNPIFGTPGGGVEKGESLEQALKREMHEEVGAENISLIKYLGKMTAYRKSINENAIFIPEHHFYLLQIHSYGSQKLMPYEKRLNLQYDYIDINEAIRLNENVLKKENLKYEHFYSNQTIVLKAIRDLFFK